MAENDATPDFTALTSELYRQWEKGMSTWWDQVLDDPSFLGAMGQSLGAQVRARKAYEQAVDDSLERAHLPTRNDLTRVARIATLLEDQLLRVEDTMLQMRDRLEAAEKEALTARIEAAEARLELAEKLDAIQGKLDALDPSPKSPRRTARKPKSEEA